MIPALDTSRFCVVALTVFLLQCCSQNETHSWWWSSRYSVCPFCLAIPVSLQVFAIWVHNYYSFLSPRNVLFHQVYGTLIKLLEIESSVSELFLHFCLMCCSTFATNLHLLWLCSLVIQQLCKTHPGCNWSVLKAYSFKRVAASAMRVLAWRGRWWNVLRAAPIFILICQFLFILWGVQYYQVAISINVLDVKHFISEIYYIRLFSDFSETKNEHEISLQCILLPYSLVLTIVIIWHQNRKLHHVSMVDSVWWFGGTFFLCT